jgi:hypothetical protein
LNIGFSFLFIYKFLFIFRKSDGNSLILLLHFCIPSFINFCVAKQPGLGEIFTKRILRRCLNKRISVVTHLKHRKVKKISFLQTFNFQKVYTYALLAE